MDFIKGILIITIFRPTTISSKSIRNKPSTNRKVRDIQNTYKQIMKDVFKKQRAFNNRAKLKISRSQNRILHSSNGHERDHIQKMRETQNSSFNRVQDDNNKFLKDIEEKINQK